MIIKLTLTEEHLKLIRLIRFEIKSEDSICIDTVHPYILSDQLQDLALALGYEDKAIKGTEDSIEGAAFPDDVEEHILDIHHYIVYHLIEIESLIHQFVTDGGITPGTYKAIDSEMIWEKVK